MEENVILNQEEKDELELLRADKKRSELTEIAKVNLKKYGVFEDFAPFLVGNAEEDTLENVKAFATKIGCFKENIIKENVVENHKEPTISLRPRRGIRLG